MMEQCNMQQEDRDMLIRIDERVSDMRVEIGVLFKAIEGNGTPGLKQRVTALEASKSAVEASMAPRLAIVSMLVALAGVAVAYFK